MILTIRLVELVVGLNSHAMGGKKFCYWLVADGQHRNGDYSADSNRLAQLKLCQTVCRTGQLMAMAFSSIDSKSRKAVKCSHEAISIRNLAVQYTNGSFVYSRLGGVSIFLCYQTKRK